MWMNITWKRGCGGEAVERSDTVGESLVERVGGRQWSAMSHWDIPGGGGGRGKERNEMTLWATTVEVE